ncbi:MAG TPA: PhoH family protein [Chlamydiales bacterium]|nr:MAG: ATPase [Verrucomicrobia bacterium RIFCSPHIGHO2_12_FULL_41_10]HLB53281.1 PhoH family protein [Chlamydiales bacterium]
MRKTFVVDTNVLVHDPNAIKNFKENDVVIPLSVLEELDNIKRDSDEVGKNAREVIRYIDSLNADKKGDFHRGVEIPEGPRIRISLEGREDRTNSFPLPLDRSSNKLLFSAFLLKERGESVVLISKDFVTRVKAEAMDLEAEDYENLKTSYEEIYRGIRRMEVIKKDIDLFYKDGTLPSTGNVLFRPNEYALMTSPENSSAVCKFNDKQKKLEPLLHINRDIWGIQPLNIEQRCAVDLLLRDDVPLVTLIGPAGTGKTLLALACGMKKVFDDNLYSRILISRPIVPLGKDIGYLPGTKEEKLYHWMQPIYDNLEFLCSTTSGEGNGAATLEFIMESKRIEMEAVTYIRGRSLPKMYMIIDEAQNLTPHEVKTIISRAGKGTKVILTGDPTQIDNPYLDKDSNGLTYTISKFKNQRLFGHMFLEKTERSELASIAAELL